MLQRQLTSESVSQSPSQRFSGKTFAGGFPPKLLRLMEGIEGLTVGMVVGLVVGTAALVGIEEGRSVGVAFVGASVGMSVLKTQ